MWPTNSTWAGLVAGDHEVLVDVDAWYDGKVSAGSLVPVAMSWSSTFDGQAVRSTLDLTVQDPAGALLSEKATSQLAPYGQLIVAQVTACLPSAKLYESVPLGTFRIETAVAEYRWDRHKKTGREYPTGGVVRVQALDCLADLAEAEFAGPTAPSGTVQAAMTALARGYVGADVSSLPATTVPASVTYGDSKWDAVKALAQTAGKVPVPQRDGTMGFVSPTIGTSVWAVTVDADTLLSSSLAHDRGGLKNAVLATGEDNVDGVSPISALAQETTGPLRVSGPFKLQLRRHSSPFYRTVAQARSGAESIRDGMIRDRTVKVPFEATWNPALDVLDSVLVQYDPTRPSVVGMLTSLTVDAVSASMSGEISVPRSAL